MLRAELARAPAIWQPGVGPKIWQPRTGSAPVEKRRRGNSGGQSRPVSERSPPVAEVRGQPGQRSYRSEVTQVRGYTGQRSHRPEVTQVRGHTSQRSHRPEVTQVRGHTGQRS